jgi:molecular chaperone GrpE
MERRGAPEGRPATPPTDDDVVPVRVVDRRFWARTEEAADPGAAAAEPSRHPAFVEELEERVRRSEERLAETLAAHRRMQAEFDEARQRLLRDVDRRLEQAKAALFPEFLDVADQMDLALRAADAEEAGGASLAQGLRLIQGRLLGALRAAGLERFEVLGEPFDPERAEAVAVVPVADPADDGRVVVQQRPGYRLGDRVVRPAQVQVGRLVAPSPADPAGGGAAAPRGRTP